MKHQTVTRLLPPGGMGERIRRVKVGKLVSWDTDILTGKAKAVCASKAKQGIHSLLPIDGQVFSHLQESRAPSHITVIGKTKAVTPNVPYFPSSFPHHMVRNIPFVSWGQLSQLCPLPTSSAPLCYSLVGSCEKQKKPWLCKRCSAITKTSLCYQNSFEHKSKT